MDTEAKEFKSLHYAVTQCGQTFLAIGWDLSFYHRRQQTIGQTLQKNLSYIRLRSAILRTR